MAQVPSEAIGDAPHDAQAGSDVAARVEPDRHVRRADLFVDRELADFVDGELASANGLDPAALWSGFAAIVKDLAPINARLLDHRRELQLSIDEWHRSGAADGDGAYRSFLEEIGYVQPLDEPFTIATEGVDAEIARIAGPQLVVPVSNARYAINAVNARWGSLYDALYGTDALGDAPPAGPYDEVHGGRVVSWVRDFLDTSAPLDDGSHGDAVAYRIVDDELETTLSDGRTTKLTSASELIGWDGAPGAPSAIVIEHHGLCVEIVIDREHPVGSTDPAGIADVRLESAVTTIVDCEDSIAAVDGADKVHAYRNWFGLVQGTLTASVTKGDRTTVRTLADDRVMNGPGDVPVVLPGRSLMLVRNVGHLMMTPAVLDSSRRPIPEGILDAFVTVLCARQDAVADPDARRNGTNGAIYVVKPKMHGPAEVSFADTLFTRIEALLGLSPHTVKLGLMDEERRTTLNLSECIRAIRHRIAFVNTGFLDRTGDEIHTSMHAGPVVRKIDMKRQTWFEAYENWNVDSALACGLAGRAQIGKGMWAAPDLMGDMLRDKVGHPGAGASCAWVPSPVAATLHATHYHSVDVASRQSELLDRLRIDGPRATLDELLAIPLVDLDDLTEDDIERELENNLQGILGYVVRWVDQGIGCSKVPDIDDVGLMEDRATCRISSQHVANWLLHGIVRDEQVEQALHRMAVVVDAQNESDPNYQAMAPGFSGVAYRAARDLVFLGSRQPSGYTEPILHAHRIERKQREGAS